MVKITRTKVMNNYNKLKHMAHNSLQKHNIENAIQYISAASKLMYSYNIIYSDWELEEMLIQLSNEIFMKAEHKMELKQQSVVNGRKIVLYDWFALDNRGLTLIYLKALIELGYHVLYITYRKNKPSNMKWIMDTIQSSEKVKMYKIKNTDSIKIARELKNVIQDFGPQKALIHTMPNDVVGLAVFASFNNTMDRYMINITDHAFWLGTSAIDYSIEFRIFGYNISKKYRNIGEEKLIILPYYPAQYYEINFQGFPFNPSGKRIIFSGGALYKIRGSKLYLKIVKHILDKYEDTILLYAGNGDSTEIKKFISENRFENRMYYISERKDLFQIMRRCYFYLSTYPIVGALMAQYAVANGKLPITFAKANQHNNHIESVFINTEDIKFTYTDINQYIREIDHLLNDKNYLSDREHKLKDIIISKQQFVSELESSLTEYKTSFVKTNLEIDTNEESKIYFTNPNMKEYVSLFSDIKSKESLFKFPLEYLMNCYYKINKFKKEK